MRQNSEIRKTHLMFYGLSGEQARDMRYEIKSGLQGMYMGWGLTTCAVSGAEAAVKYIQDKENEDLEIVFYADACKGAYTPEQLLADAKVIAVALAAHPHKPWVVIETTAFEHLVPIYQSAGIFITGEMAEYAIFNRWNSQIKDEVAA